MSEKKKRSELGKLFERKKETSISHKGPREPLLRGGIRNARLLQEPASGIFKKSIHGNEEGVTNRHGPKKKKKNKLYLEGSRFAREGMGGRRSRKRDLDKSEKNR